MGSNLAKTVSIGALGPAVLVLAGCATTTSPTDSSVGPSTAAVLSAFNDDKDQATYDPSDPQTISEAQDDGAVSGFGAATGGATASTQTVGQYVIGSVDTSGGNLVLDIGGTEYTLAESGTGTTIGDFDYQGYGTVAGHGTGGDGAYLLNGDYVSLAAFMRDATEPWDEIDDGQWRVPGADGYGMLVTGLVTPEGDMPNQTASYEGEYFFAGLHDGDAFFGADGEFDMVVDFGDGTLVGFVRSYDEDVGLTPDHTRIDAKIVNGNQFDGRVKRLHESGRDSTGMNGTIAGAFYGPDADQVAGVASGKARPAGLQEDDENPTVEVDTTAVFIGTKQ